MLCTTLHRTNWVDLSRTTDVLLQGLAADADVIGRTVGVGGTQHGDFWGTSGQGCWGTLFEYAVVSKLHRPTCAQANVVVFSIIESTLNILAQSTVADKQTRQKISNFTKFSENSLNRRGLMRRIL